MSPLPSAWPVHSGQPAAVAHGTANGTLHAPRHLHYFTEAWAASAPRNVTASLTNLAAPAITSTSVEVEPEAAPETAAASGPRTPRDRFLQACACQPLVFPPVWLMRQAGRALPEYREFKTRHSFLEMVQTPELSAEITLQPIRRFDFDAAVLFSDILVVSEAMGQAYRFKEGGGVTMNFEVRNARDIDRLEPTAVRERLAYVADALGLLRAELGSRTALLGFAGSPWTLANFMMEGGSAPEFNRAKLLFHTEPALFKRLMVRIAAAVAEHLRMQIEAGADAVQIFDSLAGVLAASDYEAASASWIRTIIEELPRDIPVIIFARGFHGPWDSLIRTGARILSVDWRVPLPWVRDHLPPAMGVQGNLDPFLMTTEPEIVARQTHRLLESMRGRTGHILNLGHGLPPTARLESIEALVQTARAFK
jgi:uroporphyrinogen decarboxylase